MKRFSSEEELAGKVVEYLLSYGWEVYQEVEVKPCGRGDIIAVQNRKVWVIEAKQSLGLAVMSQAYRWLGFSHWVSVATPIFPGFNFIRRTLTTFGIGALTIDFGVSESVVPQFHRRAAVRSILDALTEEHKTWAKAGNANNSYYSPFKHTCAEILREVQQQPGILLKELIPKIKHHYGTPSNASSCIAHWSRTNAIPGIELRKENYRLRLYPREVPG